MARTQLRMESQVNSVLSAMQSMIKNDIALNLHSFDFEWSLSEKNMPVKNGPQLGLEDFTTSLRLWDTNPHALWWGTWGASFASKFGMGAWGFD